MIIGKQELIKTVKQLKITKTQNEGKIAYHIIKCGGEVVVKEIEKY